MALQFEVPASDVIDWRRHIHAHPELSYKEHATADFVVEKLTSFGLTPERPTETSVTVLIEGRGPGRTVALRADLDALPLQEETGDSFASTVDGVMHACGHDAHTAMLLGTAQVLSGLTDSFDGAVKLIFQHAEETPPGGAKELVGQGVLEGVDAIFGVHMANQATGTISVRKGVTSTVAGGFFATIKGQGSHASMPQNGVDPVLVAAQITVALNTIVSRNVAPDHMNVVNVGMIKAGEAPNVIPDTARIGVSMRTVADEDWEVLRTRATDIVENTCAAYGATATFEWADGYPVIVNDDDVAQIGFEAAVQALGQDKVSWGPGTSASDDFAYFAREVPACFVFLGGGTAEDGLPYMNHHPKFDIKEEALEAGVRTEVQMALNYLAS